MQQNLIYVQHTFQICHLKRRFSGLVDGVTANTRNSSVHGYIHPWMVQVPTGQGIRRVAYVVGWFMCQCSYKAGLWHWVV